MLEIQLQMQVSFRKG